MEEQSYIATNKAERERLETVVGRLAAGEMSHPIGHGWTVSAALAHLAHWDRHYLKLLEEAELSDTRSLSQLKEWEQEIFATPPAATINDPMLPLWLAMAGADAAREALLAAEAIDQKIESLNPELIRAILGVFLVREKRPWLIDRGTHRREHLDEIERALAGQEQAVTDPSI